MAIKHIIPLWKRAPFVRLVLPFTVGILFQYYLPVPIVFTIVFSAILIAGYILFSFLPLVYKIKFQWLQGVVLNLIILCAAIIIAWQKDIRNNVKWFADTYNDSSLLVVNINEPLVKKTNSYKTEGSVVAIVNNGNYTNTTGKILIYVGSDEQTTLPTYGDVVLIKAGIQQIKNAGNPGGFDYARYMGFHQIHHQSFIKNKKFVLLPYHHENKLYTFIYYARERTINILQKYVVGNKKVTGIAEALLIGYKEDLDKDVVQAYSNTGVVHIIAISGMHLGLIYVVLVWIFSRLPFIKRNTIVRVVLIITGMWLFSLITGASASVLRSAVMFTCVIIGKEFFKQSSIYNSLASSAFILLCYDPYLLWDVGFQLSYLAVTGIVWLQKPIESLYYTKHKPLQYLWQMCSVTLAAQVLTLPICIYYFHQIPTMFLITNLICVPLSTLILFSEILLIVISPIPIMASLIGKFIYVFTWIMNAVIQFFNGLPLSLIDKVYATPFTTILLYISVFLLTASLLRKNKLFLKVSLLTFILFSTTWAYGKMLLATQKKIIIYNVSRHTAIDFVASNNYWFWGDADFKKEGALQNFNLKPARVSLQVAASSDTLKNLRFNQFTWKFYNKKLMIIDSAVVFNPLQNKINVDVLLICKNPSIHINNITTAVKPACIVFDASNSLWKITQWIKECEDLHLSYFITGKKGAFVLNVK